MEKLSMFKVLEKDIMESKNSLILHQVNCKGVMGAGLAKLVRNDISEEDYARYQHYCKTQGSALLGKVLIFKSKSIPNRLYANLFAQDGYGRDKQYTDYKALEECFNKMSKYALYENPMHTHYKINIPYGIGCGLGGGDWAIVEKLIIKCFNNNIVRIYRKPEKNVNFSTTPSMNSHIKINNEEEKNMQDIISLLKLNEKGDSYVLNITHIKPDMCTTKQKNKFFMFENKTLTKFFYEINEEDYTKYVSYLRDNKRKVKEENLVFETASTYFKNKARLAIVKMYFGIPNSFNNLPVEVDFRGMWSKSIAKYGDENQYTAYQEDEYRENDNLSELRAKNAYELYIKEYPRSQALDEDIKAIIEELYNTIIKATQKRLIMCLDLESVLNNILNIIEYSTEGNITEFQCNSLKYSYKGLVNKLLNPDMQEFIKVHSDIDMFAEYEDTKVDYISTYQRVLRKLTAIYSDNLEYMKDIIHNEADMLEDIILANDTELIYEDYRDNSQNEYDEYLVVA